MSETIQEQYAGVDIDARGIATVTIRDAGSSTSSARR